jgi:hypothetical protein
MKASRKLLVLTPLCALMAAGSAYATDGYFPVGYGMKAKGMGGTSLTQTDNAFAGANNPAIAAFAGNRVDLGLDVFMPDRGMSRTGSMFGLDANVESGSGTFLVPEFGYNAMVNEKNRRRNHGLRQRRHEHRLPRRTDQLWTRPCQRAVRIGQSGHQHVATDRCTDCCLQAESRSRHRTFAIVRLSTVWCDRAAGIRPGFPGSPTT